MTTHVFIVNEVTFPAHLEYMFAGTSAGKMDWNIGLLADIKRVRTGDKVIFYFEGVGFYGIFKVKENVNSDGKHIIYYDKDNFCKGLLGKKLLYRILVEPDEVYSNPISEWDALEKLPDNPRDIIWSLIYRKLKGGRGCTPITPKEAVRLINLIRDANKNKELYGQHFSWENGVIIETKKTLEYDGSKAEIMDIEKILYSHRNAETYLQAYFTENIGLEKLDSSVFSEICGKGNEIFWIGNEVFCGVGMQKIDIFSIVNINKEIKFNVVELKVVIDINIAYQLERYVKWCLEYLNGTASGVKPENLYPAVVLPQPKGNAEKKSVKKLSDTLLKFNDSFKDRCKPLRYCQYYFDKNKQIKFDKRVL